MQYNRVVICYQFEVYICLHVRIHHAVFTTNLNSKNLPIRVDSPIGSPILPATTNNSTRSRCNRIISCRLHSITESEVDLLDLLRRSISAIYSNFNLNLREPAARCTTYRTCTITPYTIYSYSMYILPLYKHRKYV